LPMPTAFGAGNLYRAAVILASLEEEVAADICRYLDRETVQDLAAQIAALGPVASFERRALLGDFLEAFQDRANLGGREYARQLLTKVFGSEGVEDDLFNESRTHLWALRAMAEREPHVLWRALEIETPQVIAVVLAQLRAPDAAALLQLMPPDLRAAILYRAANLGPTAPGALEMVARSLTEATPSTITDEGGAQSSGIEFLVEIMQNVDRTTEKQVMESLREVAPEFAATMEERLVTFEDIFQIESRALQNLLRQVVVPTLALALRGADERLRQAASANLSTRMQEELAQEIELMGPVRVTQVEEAQREVTNLARSLEEKGELDLRRGKVEYI